MQASFRCAALVCLLLSSGATAAPIDDMRSAAAKIRDDVTSIQGVYESLAARDAGADDNLLRLNLKNRDNKLLLRLHIHCRGNSGAWGAAYSTSQKWIHRIEAEGLTVAKQLSGRKVTGPVVIHVVTADDIGPEAVPARITIRLNLTVSGNEVNGTFDAERSAELQFAGSGTVESAGDAPPPSLPPPPQSMKISEANSATVYLLCQFRHTVWTPKWHTSPSSRTEDVRRYC